MPRTARRLKSSDDRGALGDANVHSVVNFSTNQLVRVRLALRGIPADSLIGKKARRL